MSTLNRIDELRFVKVFKPHMGEQGSVEVADALQDELEPVATKSDLEVLRDLIRADITQAVNSMLFKVTALWAALLTAAVLILRFT